MNGAGWDQTTVVEVGIGVLVGVGVLAAAALEIVFWLRDVRSRRRGRPFQ